MKRFFFLAFLGVLPGFFLPAQLNLQPAAEIQLIRTEPIPVSELKPLVEQLETQYRRKLTVEERKQVLDELINQKLVLQAAERDKLTVTDNEVTQAIRAAALQTYGRQPSDAELAAEVRKQTGLDMNAYRQQYRKQATIEKYLRARKTVNPATEAEIDTAYNLNKTQFIRPETVRVSMIQIPLGDDAAGKTRAKELAERLSREIGSNPAKFDETTLRAQSPNSGYQGGDFGYLPRNPQGQQAVGTELLEAAFKLKQGEVSPLVETSRGFFIIKVTETYEMKPLNLDDIAQPGSQTTVRQFIGSRLEQERLLQASQELVDELRKQAALIKIYDNNLNW
ncbi:MAG: peptidyl-prolyl cis-trans isomerase [Treponema sp.]|nr:peptidyl-prolyl cis-trans isomerase [Treponema sp.]